MASWRPTPLVDGVVGRARGVADVLATTYQAWRDDRCIRLGAGLAYYGLFALVPVLTLAIALAAVVFSADEVQAFVAAPLARLVGAEAEEIAARIAGQLTASDLPGRLGSVGIVSMLFAASLVFVALQDALNVIWHVPHESGIRSSIRRRLLSFAVVLGTGGVIVGSLAVQAVVALPGDLLPVAHPLMTGATEAASRLVPLGVGAVALALLFTWLPRARVHRHAAVVAGGTTAIAMAVGALAIGLYLRRFGAGSAQQAAGSVVVALTGLYAESQVLLAGAELSKVLTRRWGAAAGAGTTRPG